MESSKITDNQKNQKLKEKEERIEVEKQYDCFKFCRCCPFPGYKCVENGKPHK